MNYKPDPIVEEVRRVREQQAAEKGYNIRALFQAVQAQQSESKNSYVRYPPRNVRGVTMKCTGAE